jgi:hypothetical protein
LINRLQGHSKRLGQGPLAPDDLDDFLQHEHSKAQGLAKCKHSLDTLARESLDNEAMLYDTDRLAVAQRLKSAMDAAGVENVDLSELTGVSLQGVGSWLRTGRIDRKWFPKIAKIVNRTPEWLLTGLDPDSILVAESFQVLPADLKPSFQKAIGAVAKSTAKWDPKVDPDRRMGGQNP